MLTAEMMTITCEGCGRRIDAARGGTSPCAVCQLERVPPEPLALHGKWSPLAVGALSLVCDPMLITTVIAVSRGVGRLGAAARYEREVGYHPSMPSIRTDAVWGLVLGSLRIWVVFGILAALLLTALFLLRPAPGVLVSYPDERTEILSGLASDDRDERALAARHARETLELDSAASSAPNIADQQILITAFARAIDDRDQDAALDLASVLISIGARADDLSAFYRAGDPSVRSSLLVTAALGPSVDDTVFSDLLRVEAELLRAGGEHITARRIVTAGFYVSELATIASQAPRRRIDLALLRANADLPTFAELLAPVCARADLDCGVTP